MLAIIHEITRTDDGSEIDNSLPSAPVYPSHGLPPGQGVVAPPIVLPPLPGIWPPPGKPNLPVDPGFGVGGGRPSHPIFIPSPKPPDNSIEAPPGTIWPPLPPETGTAGKFAILIWVVGVGYRWFITEGTTTWPPPPPTPTPK